MKEDWVLLSSLTQACKLNNDTVRTHLLIRKNLLTVLIGSLNKFYTTPQPYLTVMYKVLLGTAYYGLFRVGELTSSPHVVKAVDVRIGLNKNKLMFVLHTSKTHTGGDKPQIIKINSVKKDNNDNKYGNLSQHLPSICPFTLLKDYLKLRKKYKDEKEQFFVFRDRTPVTQLLKKLLQFNNINQAFYSTHALRSGRSSDLLEIGVSVETIRKLGRWRSNAVYTYLRP